MSRISLSIFPQLRLILFSFLFSDSSLRYLFFYLPFIPLLHLLKSREKSLNVKIFAEVTPEVSRGMGFYADIHVI